MWYNSTLLWMWFLPDFIDNVHKTLSQSLKNEIKSESKISIPASCFSIYAYQELQKELKDIDELLNELQNWFHWILFLHYSLKKEFSWQCFVKSYSLLNGCRKQKLQKEIDKLEKLARKESQPKKKFELVSQKRKLEKELNRL